MFLTRNDRRKVVDLFALGLDIFVSLLCLEVLVIFDDVSSSLSLAEDALFWIAELLEELLESLISSISILVVFFLAFTFEVEWLDSSQYSPNNTLFFSGTLVSTEGLSLSLEDRDESSVALFSPPCKFSKYSNKNPLYQISVIWYMF